MMGSFVIAHSCGLSHIDTAALRHAARYINHGSFSFALCSGVCRLMSNANAACVSLPKVREREKRVCEPAASAER